MARLSNFYDMRPVSSKMLEAARLDVFYTRGDGAYLYYSNTDSDEVEVIDYVGGFGSGLFGHSHPDIQSVLHKLDKSNTPYFVQASYRSAANRLATTLNTALKKRFGREYVSVFANTGTEAVEIALKHAELSRRLWQKRTLEKIEGQFFHSIESIRSGETTLSPAWEECFQSLLGAPCTLKNIDRWYDRCVDYMKSELLGAPVFVAVQRAFHGKTSGALQLTYNEDYRSEFSQLGPQTIFIEPENIHDLEKIIATHTQHYYLPEINEKNELVLTKKAFSNIAGLFVEPIQGEGGVHVLSSEYLQVCRKKSVTHGFPLIFDEIQCGMGRTGTLLFSEQLDVIADYYLLGKSLGGGYGKISATLIRRDQYQDSFDLVHSSTFSEDEYSATAAWKSLDLLENEAWIFERIIERSSVLETHLQKIKDEYPSMINDVRGRGLMFGVELNLESVQSPLLQCMLEQNLLGWAIAGFLLHHFDIRIAPALCAGNVIRLQPSYFISDKDIRSLITVMRCLCDILSRHNAYALLSYMVESSEKIELVSDKPVKRYSTNDHFYRDYSKREVVKQGEGETEGIARVAFIGHFGSSIDATLWDPSLVGFTEEQLNSLLERLHPISGLAYFPPQQVVSSSGEKVALYFIGIFANAKNVSQFIGMRRPNYMHSLIERGVEHAKNIGCRMVGLGGYTSILTNNAKSLPINSIGLTTGNALTVAMSVKATQEAIRQSAIGPQNCHYASVGANGNIAQVYNEMMALIVPSMLLVGRPGSEKRLIVSAKKIYCSVYEEIFKNIHEHANENVNGNTNEYVTNKFSGIAKAMVNSRAVKDLISGHVQVASDRLGDYFYEQYLKKPPIRISTDMASISDCNVVMTASNTPQTILFPEMFHRPSVVICDIAVPRDTDRDAFSSAPHIKVFQGGIVSLGRNRRFTVPGLPLAAGETYACLSETLLLGFAGQRAHYSYGDVTKKQAEEILALSEKHGFNLAQLKIEDPLECA